MQTILTTIIAKAPRPIPECLPKSVVASELLVSPALVGTWEWCGVVTFLAERLSNGGAGVKFRIQSDGFLGVAMCGLFCLLV
jgi:hypothetical protein